MDEFKCTLFIFIQRVIIEITRLWMNLDACYFYPKNDYRNHPTMDELSHFGRYIQKDVIKSSKMDEFLWVIFIHNWNRTIPENPAYGIFYEYNT